jgi:purine nucleosidase
MGRRVGGLENRFARFLSESTGYDRVTEKFLGGRNTFYLHDPLAVAAAVRPDLLETEKMNLQVVTEPGERYGKTEEMKNERPGDRGISVGFKVDAKAFLDLFISRLKE